MGSRPGTHSLPHRARTAVRLTMPSTTLGPVETKSPPFGGVALQDDVGHAVVVAVVEVGLRPGRGQRRRPGRWTWGPSRMVSAQLTIAAASPQAGPPAPFRRGPDPSPPRLDPGCPDWD